MTKWNLSRFQSTLPRGSDLMHLRLNLTSSNFNPRSLAGATVCRSALIGLFGTFQSTLPRGSDYVAVFYTASAVISIHAPSRERHFVLWLVSCWRSISIHAPSRERQHQNKILLHSFKSSIYCELAQFKSLKILFWCEKTYSFPILAQVANLS